MIGNKIQKFSNAATNAESRMTLSELRPEGIKVIPTGPQGALEDMIRNAPGAIALLDDSSRHLEVSDEYCAQFRLSRLAILGKGFSQLLNQVPRELPGALALTLAGETMLLEMTWPFGDGRDGRSYSVRLHPWRRNRRAIGGSILFLDPLPGSVATHSTPGEMTNLLEEAPGLLATTDGNGRISFMNSAGRAMLGLSSMEEAQRHEMASFCWKSAITNVHSLAPNKPWMGEMLLHNPLTGKTFPMTMLAFSVAGADGATAGSAYYGVQISGGNAAKVPEECDEPQFGLKLETVCRATREIAHDLNNTLLVIMCYAGLLSEELGKNSLLAVKADAIHRAGERGAELTEQLLALSHKQKGPSPVAPVGTPAPEELQ